MPRAPRRLPSSGAAVTPVGRRGLSRSTTGATGKTGKISSRPFRAVDGERGLQRKRPGPFSKAFWAGSHQGSPWTTAVPCVAGTRSRLHDTERVHDTCRRFVQALRWVQDRQPEPAHGSAEDDFARFGHVPVGRLGRVSDQAWVTLRRLPRRSLALQRPPRRDRPDYLALVTTFTANSTWVAPQLPLVRAIINDMAYCDLCEMDRGFCEHGLTERRRNAAAIAGGLLISPNGIVHFPGCHHKGDDPDYSGWARLDTPRVWERLGNGEQLAATGGQSSWPDRQE